MSDTDDGQVVDLTAAAKAATPSTRPGRQSFMDRLTPNKQQSLLNLRRDVQAGELDNWTPKQLLRDIVVPEIGEIGITPQRFGQWLKERDH